MKEKNENFWTWFRRTRIIDFCFLAIFIAIFLQFKVWVVDMEEICYMANLGLKGKLNFTNLTEDQIIEGLNINETIIGECCPCGH